MKTYVLVEKNITRREKIMAILGIWMQTYVLSYVLCINFMSYQHLLMYCLWKKATYNIRLRMTTLYIIITPLFL